MCLGHTDPIIGAMPPWTMPLVGNVKSTSPLELALEKKFKWGRGTFYMTSNIPQIWIALTVAQGDWKGPTV
jgi:hypothetical protein